MISAIIIDDEKDNRILIRHFLEELKMDIRVESEADSVETGIQHIRNIQPDLVFLDIRLRGRTGFEILEAFPNRNFEVLLVTAYPEYEPQVRSLGLFFYIMKPIEIEKLRDALLEIQEIIALKHLRRIREFKQVLIPTRYGLKFLHIDEIAWCETIKNEKKTKIHLTDGGEITGNKHMLFFEVQLKPFSFVRVHHAFIVNVNHIDRYYKGDGGYLFMKDGAKINVARKRKDTFLDFIKKFYFDLNSNNDE